ncbi:MAG: transposase family protein, partial [Casimicrobiaceae bacterium]
SCQNCQSPSMYRHGAVEQTYRDIPSHGQAVTLLVARQRFRCQRCAKTQFDAIPDLDDRASLRVACSNTFRPRVSVGRFRR